MTWSKIEQFQSCQILNIFKYINLQKHTPLQIFIFLSKLKNIGVSLSFQETNKALSRNLKSNILAYDGPAFIYKDLNIPRELGGMFKISQNIYSEEEENKKCRNYPYNDFLNFRDCDEKYNHDKFTNDFKVMPFWVASSLNETSAGR